MGGRTSQCGRSRRHSSEPHEELRLCRRVRGFLWLCARLHKYVHKKRSEAQVKSGSSSDDVLAMVESKKKKNRSPPNAVVERGDG